MDIAIIFLCILLVPCILFTIINTVYNKYKDVDNKKKLSGFEVAREILDSHGLDKIYIVEVKSNLSDHYDSDHKVLRLSSDVFHGESLTAAAVAARVANYAVQDKEGYTLMKFRSFLNKIITFVNYAAYILFIVGLALQDVSILEMTNYFILLVLAFHLVTLPVEFDVCKRAKKDLDKNDILTKKELEEVDNVFKVSPYTFIMSMITCVSTLVSEFMYNIQRRG